MNGNAWENLRFIIDIHIIKQNIWSCDEMITETYFDQSQNVEKSYIFSTSWPLGKKIYTLLRLDMLVQ